METFTSFLRSSLSKYSSPIRSETTDVSIKLSFEDYPKPNDWHQVQGLFSDDDSKIISSIPTKTDGQYRSLDYIFRFGYPIDLRPAPSPRIKVLTLATAEYATSDIFRSFGSPPWSKPGNITLMVPSHWSIDLFKDLAHVPADNMFFLPHGFDSSYFYPTSKRTKRSKECLDFRKGLNISSTDFIFLNTGAATVNKNIVMLIQTFAKIHLEYPNAVLLLKSLTDLYPQGVENILQAVSGLSNKEAVNRIIWLDRTSSNGYMGSLYRCANIYVAPYQAEGFNLPVLESLASGTPVIVPKGGSTDDFTRSKFTRYIAATISETSHPQTREIMNRLLVVDELSLLSEMKFVLEDHLSGMKWLKKASKAATKFALGRYEWRHIMKRLLEYLAQDGNSCFKKILSQKNEL